MEDTTTAALKLNQRGKMLASNQRCNSGRRLFLLCQRRSIILLSGIFNMIILCVNSLN